ncbi:MAG TPA: OmpH family outer membrane protein [Candidatus Gastranaerophilaceae bacterium]|nr:OmpH family outer membrane protein [Candidatus Gastranaerophilaceae bacterium]HPT41771.1 OmpH family outer membrane protein [Candidatus Gastranaerophilaceae bacterium]
MKIKFTVLAFAIMVFAWCSLPAKAEGGIGYINYKKIQESCPFAQAAVKEVDAKGLELQQYLVDKEKEFKALDTPIKKKNFEEKTAKEFKLKEEAYMKLKMQKEEAVYNKIQEAARQVLIEQKLDTIVDFRIIFVGGIDVTDLVLQKLK